MKRIKLEIAEWEYDPSKQLGLEGGFGVVFAGKGAEYSKVAIKKLKIGANEAAHRELKIAKELEGRKLANVIPMYDSGQDANSNSYFVVMALAEKSLEDELKNGKPLDDMNAVNILLDIVNGLCEVSDIVHRDLKPANVLYHEGKWKVADFGIARFVEDFTSVHTLKDCLSPQYAAPEQWKFEHATSATDIYALGCIGYFLLTGQPPFNGPSNADFKYQHLSQVPPCLEVNHPQLASLLSMMLRKTLETRPDIDRVKKILSEIVESDNEHSSEVSLKELAQAGAEVASREAEAEAKRKQEESQIQRRKDIAKDALGILNDIKKRLFDKICIIAPTAKKSENENVIIFGQAQLSMHSIYKDERLVLYEAFPQSHWDVLAAGEIYVKQRNPEYEWSASLWYSKLPTDAKYRWREVSYFMKTGITKYQLGIKFEPFALRSLSDADEAASPVMGVYQIADGPKIIDDEDFDEFCNRWTERLAKAAVGQLGCPRQLPRNEAARG